MFEYTEKFSIILESPYKTENTDKFWQEYCAERPRYAENRSLSKEGMKEQSCLIFAPVIISVLSCILALDFFFFVLNRAVFLTAVPSSLI